MDNRVKGDPKRRKVKITRSKVKKHWLKELNIDNKKCLQWNLEYTVYTRGRHVDMLPPSQNKYSFILFTSNVWLLVLFEIFLWLVFLLLVDDKT